ncbi:hypothetical protein JCM10212_001113 [Sporobolomyces blumeae]
MRSSVLFVLAPLLTATTTNAFAPRSDIVEADQQRIVNDGLARKRWVWATSIIQDGDEGAPPVGDNVNLLSGSTDPVSTPEPTPTPPSFPPQSNIPSSSSALPISSDSQRLLAGLTMSFNSTSTTKAPLAAARPTTTVPAREQRHRRPHHPAKHRHGSTSTSISSEIAKDEDDAAPALVDPSADLDKRYYWGPSIIQDPAPGDASPSSSSGLPPIGAGHSTPNPGDVLTPPTFPPRPDPTPSTSSTSNSTDDDESSSEPTPTPTSNSDPSPSETPRYRGHNLSEIQAIRESAKMSYESRLAAESLSREQAAAAASSSAGDDGNDDSDADEGEGTDGSSSLSNGDAGDQDGDSPPDETGPITPAPDPSTTTTPHYTGHDRSEIQALRESAKLERISRLSVAAAKKSREAAERATKTVDGARDDPDRAESTATTRVWTKIRDYRSKIPTSQPRLERVVRRSPPREVVKHRRRADRND